MLVLIFLLFSSIACNILQSCILWLVSWIPDTSKFQYLWSIISEKVHSLWALKHLWARINSTKLRIFPILLFCIDICNYLTQIISTEHFLALFWISFFGKYFYKQNSLNKFSLLYDSFKCLQKFRCFEIPSLISSFSVQNSHHLI